MKVGAVSQQEDGVNYITTCYWKHELMHIRTTWSVSHTWEQWKDIHAYIEYISTNKNYDLPSLPKSHLVMTTLLIDDRMNALNRYFRQLGFSSRYVQELMKYDKIISSYEVSKFFGIATHIRKEKCAVLCVLQQNGSKDKNKEQVVENIEERFVLSDADVSKTDPISYLTTR